MMLDSEPGIDYVLPFALYTCLPAIVHCQPSPHLQTILVELALPLEAESLVDKKFAEEGDDGHDDGNAAFVLVHLVFAFTVKMRTYPRTTTRGLR
jgi:hypothetical protein